MQKILFVLLLLLINGCSVNTLFLGDVINKVTVVRYSPYVKHHRAYFSRSSLRTIIHDKKYLFLYNEKNNDVGILLRRKQQYLLYNMSTPKQHPFAIKTNKKIPFEQILKSFTHKGYKPIKSLTSVGYITQISYKRYKGVKTILIELKEYSRLQKLYQNAIKNYNAESVKKIKTQLPKVLISSYYTQYKKQAKKREQLIQLKIIAKKLNLKEPIISNNKKIKNKKTPQTKKALLKQKYPKKKITDNKHIETTQNNPTPKEVEKEHQTHVNIQKKSSEKPYNYYLNKAPLGELSTYISSKTTRDSLSYDQYNMLTQRKIVLQEEWLLNHGTLEELIATYKINKNTQYKQRIMSLIKAQQTKH